jgi:hypothetical protein
LYDYLDKNADVCRLQGEYGAFSEDRSPEAAARRGSMINMSYVAKLRRVGIPVTPNKFAYWGKEFVQVLWPETVGIVDNIHENFCLEVPFVCPPTRWHMVPPPSEQISALAIQEDFNLDLINPQKKEFYERLFRKVRNIGVSIYAPDAYRFEVREEYIPFTRGALDSVDPIFRYPMGMSGGLDYCPYTIEKYNREMLARPPGFPVSALFPNFRGHPL